MLIQGNFEPPKPPEPVSSAELRFPVLSYVIADARLAAIPNLFCNTSVYCNVDLEMQITSLGNSRFPVLCQIPEDSPNPKPTACLYRKSLESPTRRSNAHTRRQTAQTAIQPPNYPTTADIGYQRYFFIADKPCHP